MKNFASVAAAASALFISAPAAAQAPAQSGSVIIPTTGLDLDTPAGRRSLDARIRAAARDACTASPADLSAQNRADRCRADLIAAARVQRDIMLAARGGGGAGMLAARR